MPYDIPHDILNAVLYKSTSKGNYSILEATPADRSASVLGIGCTSFRFFWCCFLVVVAMTADQMVVPLPVNENGTLVKTYKRQEASSGSSNTPFRAPLKQVGEQHQQHQADSSGSYPCAASLALSSSKASDSAFCCTFPVSVFNTSLNAIVA